MRPIRIETKMMPRSRHDPGCIRSLDPTRDSITDVYGPVLNSVKLVTLAPELPGALDVVARLNRAGIVVAAGRLPARTAWAQARTVSPNTARSVSRVGTVADGAAHGRPLGRDDCPGRGQRAHRHQHGHPPVQCHDPGTHQPPSARTFAREADG